MQVKLEAKTPSAARRLAAHGSWWTVVAGPKTLEGYEDEGPLHYLKPSRLIRGKAKGLGSHWVSLTQDNRYEIVETLA